MGIDAVSNAGKEPLGGAVDRAFGDEGFDVAFEAAGNGAAMDQAITAIGKGGTIVVVGVFGSKPPIDMARVGEHELLMIGSMMYRHEDYDKAVEWIADGTVRTGPLESRHFPLDQYAEAYRYLEEQGVQSMKVFVDL